MSSLLFYTDEGEAIVATDTLLNYSVDTPPGYVSKAIALPHIRMIIAATGSALLFSRWIGLVNYQGTALDIDAVDADATEALQSLWGELNAQFPSLHQQTATVYHFGFSDNARVIHGYAYRSRLNFKSEKLKYGMGHKPELVDLTGIDWSSFPSSAPEIMRAQILQESGSKNDRIHIGGSVQITHLTDDGFSVYSMGELS